MTLARKYPALGSSQDPDKISLTIKSVGLALIPVLLAILKAVGYESFTENDLVVFVNALATIASMAGVVWGVLRKFKKN